MRPVILLTVTALVAAWPAQAQQAPGCVGDPAYHALDFWHGEWRVEGPDGTVYGHNRIEPVLGGCAVMEYWAGADGNPGTSLFYRKESEWRQIWVTPFAQSPGGVKEKRQVAGYNDSGIRFQGEISLPDGGSYLDRTTLSLMSEGRVRQLIEVSRDGGETWETTFDAIYLPQAPDEGQTSVP